MISDWDELSLHDSPQREGIDGHTGPLSDDDEQGT